MKERGKNKCCTFEMAVICQQKGIMLDSFNLYIVSIDEVRLIQSCYSNKNDYKYIVGTYECYVCFTIGQIMQFLSESNMPIYETSTGLFVAQGLRFKDIEDAIFYSFSFIDDVNHKDVDILVNHLKSRGKLIKPQIQ